MKVTNIPRLMLRCFAQKDGAQWVAVCVDLNLAAQADTCAEAKKRLDAQIIHVCRHPMPPYLNGRGCRVFPSRGLVRWVFVVKLG